MNKKMKWLLPICILVLILAGVLSGCQQQQQEQTPATDVKLAWNVDGADFLGNIRRTPADSGNYIVDFAIGGERKRLEVTPEVYNKGIDIYSVVGLVQDENGLVTDFRTVEECTGGYYMNKFYVENIDGNKILCNSSAVYKGYQKTLELTEDIPVYRYGDTGPLTGMKTQVSQDDEIIAVQDENGEILVVYVSPVQDLPDMYWSIERQYNSTNKITSREPDATGCYSYDMVCNGELVTVKTREMRIANAMDAIAGRILVLEFDENGYVSGVREGGKVASGYYASWYNVQDVTDGVIIARRNAESKWGTIAKAAMASNYMAYDVSSPETMGQITELRPGDLITSLYDHRGCVFISFVLTRCPGTEVYWNVERMYNSATKLSTRKPDHDGWYRILLAVNGEQKIFKTKDKTLVQSIDARADKHFGLAVDGNVITGYYNPNDVGGTMRTFGSWYHVTGINDGMVQVERKSGSNKGKTAMAMMRSDCKIYDVTTTAGVVGEETDLRVGDQIVGQYDYNGDVYVIYVVNRLVESRIYWNVERKWDSTNGVSTRKPAEDGYYYILLAVDGQQVTYKTKDPYIVHSIDGKADKHFGLKRRGDEIIKYYTPAQVTGGGVFGSWYDVTYMEDGVITVTRTYSTNIGKTQTAKRATNCQIFDVTPAANMVGEVTNLRMGDRICGVTNTEGELVVIYVVEKRYISGTQFYWNLERKWDSKTGTTKRIPDADGWYHIKLATGGQQVTLKTQDYGIANSIDAKVDSYFSLKVEGDVITRYCDPKTTVGGGVFGSWYDVTDLSNGVVTVERTLSGSNHGKIQTAPMAEGCEVYNVSTTFDDFKGEKTTLRIGDRICGHKDKNGKLVIAYVVERTDAPAEPDHFHCLCGGTVSGHSCDETTGWSVWTSSVRLPTSGYYYLTKDVNLSALTAAMSIDGELHICLNGHTITGPTAKISIWYVKNYFSISDCCGGGSVVTQSSQNGALLHINNKDREVTFELYGGTMKATGVSGSTGLIFVGNNANQTLPARFNMYGGALTGGNVTGGAGAVNVLTKNAEFNMYGGTISGNMAKGNGGAVHIGANTTFNIYGGTITGNTAGKGAVYVLGTLNVAGNANISCNAGGNVYLPAGKTVTCGDLTTDASIGITMEGSGVFTTLADTSLKSVFTSDESIKIAELTGGQLALVVEHTHCVCGGTVSGHSCDDGAIWTAWESANSLPATSGYYYLTKDVDLSARTSAYNMGTDVELHLCLNGHTIKGPTAKVSIWYVKKYFSISDCAGGGIVLTQSAQNGALLHINNKETEPVFELYGGTLKAGGKSGSTGLIFVGNNAKQTLPAYFNMYGGELTGGDVTGGAGAVNMLTKNSVFNMYGGIITGNTAQGKGGAVYVGAQATFNMEGGTITGNTGGTGTVYVVGTLKLSGPARIEGNSGGEIYIESGSVKVGTIETDAIFGIAMKTPGAFVTTAVDLTSHFVSTMSGYTVKYEDGKMVLS